MKKLILLSYCLTVLACQSHSQQDVVQSSQVMVGAERMNLYIPTLEDKRVGLVVNPSSRVGKAHLLDTLLARNILISKIFSPEHGLRGDKDAGELIENNVDVKTGIPVISLYGSNKKPSQESLNGLDVVVFDIQDVGTRFFTYISTMHYVMEACAEAEIPVIILDRPNPNGHYVDGPIRAPGFESFVGMHPIPIVHGMTVGELARMIVGEGWIDNANLLELQVIRMENWTHLTKYALPVKPSPNLPNALSIALYPSLCLFEGTIVSVGRGTPAPFQVIGHPSYTKQGFSFTPHPNEGSKSPPLQDQKCYGINFREDDVSSGIDLSHLINFYNDLKGQEPKFFNSYFNTLAGNDILQQQIKDGLSEEEIKMTWRKPLLEFKTQRKKYLLYKDFE